MTNRVKELASWIPHLKHLPHILKNVFSAYGSFLLLTALVAALDSTSLVARAREREFLSLPGEQVIKTVDAVGQYTAAIDEDAYAAASLFSDLETGLIKKPEITETIVSPRSYTVAQGDTISTIARKFNLNVATILDANNMKGSDTTTLKQGQTLTIPPENTSNSLAWLEEEQRLKAERERKARLESQRKLAQSATARSGPQRASSRETADDGFDGESGESFITPIRHNGVTRCGLRYHLGADYRADTGTPVVAAASGRITETTAGWGSGFGVSAYLTHSGGWGTRYAHLSKLTVGVGDIVNQGEVIGYSGNTGFSTGPHLHFGKYLNGREVKSC